MASRWIWVAGGVAAVAGIGAGVAFAQSEMSKRGGWHEHRGGGMGGMFRRVRTKDDALERARARFARIDANSDGVADRDEIGAMIERRRERRAMRRAGRRMERRAARMARRFDANRDGRVTPDEIRSRVAERFARNDIDADGAITDADLPPMLRGRDVLSSNNGWLPRRRWARRLARLRRANANNDDRVTLEELQAFAIARFERFDANKDGALDETDRNARRAAMVDYRVSRMLARFGAAGKDNIDRAAFLSEVEKRFERRDLDGDGVLSRSERRSHRWGRKWRGSDYGSERGYGRGWREGRGEGRRWRDDGARPQRSERGASQRELNWLPENGTEDGVETDVQRDVNL